MKYTFSEKERELVMARLATTSPDFHLSIGGTSVTYSRNELIDKIKNDDPIGNDYIRMELEFLRAIKDGSLMASIRTA